MCPKATCNQPALNSYMKTPLCEYSVESSSDLFWKVPLRCYLIHSPFRSTWTHFMFPHLHVALKSKIHTKTMRTIASALPLMRSLHLLAACGVGRCPKPVHNRLEAQKLVVTHKRGPGLHATKECNHARKNGKIF